MIMHKRMFKSKRGIERITVIIILIVIVILAGIMVYLYHNYQTNTTNNKPVSTSSTNSTTTDTTPTTSTTGGTTLNDLSCVWSGSGNATQSGISDNQINFALEVTNKGNSSVTANVTNILLLLPNSIYENSGFTIKLGGTDVTSTGFQVGPSITDTISITAIFGSYPYGDHGEITVTINYFNLGTQTYNFTGKAP